MWIAYRLTGISLNTIAVVTDLDYLMAWDSLSNLQKQMQSSADCVHSQR